MDCIHHSINMWSALTIHSGRCTCMAPADTFIYTHFILAKVTFSHGWKICLHLYLACNDIQDVPIYDKSRHTCSLHQGVWLYVFAICFTWECLKYKHAHACWYCHNLKKTFIVVILWRNSHLVVSYHMEKVIILWRFEVNRLILATEKQSCQ